MTNKRYIQNCNNRQKVTVSRIIIMLVGLLYLTTSCEDIINEENISNKSIQLIAPANNVSLTAGEISFHWETQSGADRYNIQIATPNFTEAKQVLLDTIISKTNIKKSLGINNYEWRVKGLNSAYETNFTTQTFVVN